MGFLIQTGSSNLFTFTESRGHDGEIKFWVAVIRKSDGKGWLSTEQSLDYIYGHPTKESYVTNISLSSLTSGKITNQSQLGNDYNVYIVVKSTTMLTASSYPDLNNNAISSAFNVIQVYPRPYTIP